MTSTMASTTARFVLTPTLTKMSCTGLAVAHLLLSPLFAGSALCQNSAQPRRTQAPPGAATAASGVSQPPAAQLPAPTPGSKKAAEATLAEEGGPVSTGWDA